MPTQATVQRAFSGGEISPQMGARADQAQYATGLAKCKNFLVQREGGVVNRPGTRFAGEVKDSSKATILIPFIFEGNDNTYMLEVGHLYIRWWFHGARVVVTGVTAWSGATNYVIGDVAVSGGVNYYCIADHINQIPPNASFWYAMTDDIFEIPAPWTAAQLSELQHIQSADVTTITHRSHAPRDLQRLGHTTWKIVTISTVPSIAAPTGVAASAGVVGTRTFAYQVTAAKQDTYEESLPSSAGSAASAGQPTPDFPNVVTWNAVAGAVEYYVHGDPYGNGIFGFLGTTDSLSFNDVGFSPDFTITPPIERTLFDSVDNYPGSATYYQQRRFFANSNNEPEKVWASQTGSFSNFSISTPIQDDDALEFVLASLKLSPVAHLVPLRRLLLLSDTGEWVMRGDTDGALTPITLNAEQEGYVGAYFKTKPVLIGNSLLYTQARGTVLRVLSFETELAGLGGGDIAAGLDLTVAASHLFDGFQIVDVDYAQIPDSIVWVPRSDGVLLALTYLTQAQVFAWSQHTTGASGKFERVAVIPDTTGAAPFSRAGEDQSYFIVNRTIGGVTKRYIEILASRIIFDDQTDPFFVDSGLSYTGALIDTATGLDHLEGEVVAVLVDGEVVYDGDPDGAEAESFRVSGGQIGLSLPGTEVHVGLPIRFAEIETLELDVQGSTVRDRPKKVQSLTVLLNNSWRRFWAGSDVDALLQFSPEQWEPNPDALLTGQAELNLTAAFTPGGKVVIRVTDPLPFELLGILPRLELGE